VRRLTIFYCLLTIVSTAFAETAMINSFSKGEITDKLGARTDVQAYYSACRELTNMYVKPRGGVEKRPGTYYIPCSPVVVIIPGTPAVPEIPYDYPILRETDDQADPGLTHTLAITNLADLQAMESNLSGNYYLTGDIDATGSAALHGGLGFDPIETFTGTFDGCGYTITGLFINRAAYTVGLFGIISGPAKIANVTLADCDISGWNQTGSLVGDVQAEATGEPLIQNCHSTGTVKTYLNKDGTNTGGLIGRLNDSSTYACALYDCSSTCDVDVSNASISSNHLGGLIGQSMKCTIINSFATGEVITGGKSVNRAGGLIGYAQTFSVVTYCYATGDIGATDNCGGLVGEIHNAGCTFAKCYATGNTATLDDWCGGFVGRCFAVSITDCYAWGTATATDDVAGGFVAYGGGPVGGGDTIYTNCYSVGAASADAEEGGFTGFLDATCTSCYWDTEASGNATTSDSSSTGHITTWMKRKSNFEDAGWDMDTIWIMEYTPEVPAVPDTEIETEIDPHRLIPFECANASPFVIAMDDKKMAFFKSR